MYTPGVNVWLPSSVAIVVTSDLPAASLYAVTRSSFAFPATASAICTEPLVVTSPCPVKAVPGCNPISPLIVVSPVLVIVDPAKTAKLDVVPKFTVG